MKSAMIAVLALASLVMVGCGGSKESTNTVQPPPPNVANVAGSWTVRAATDYGPMIMLETNLVQDGTALRSHDRDIGHPDLVPLYVNEYGDVYLEGGCGVTGQSQFNGTIDSHNQITFTLKLGPATYNGTATLSADRTTLTGNYRSAAGSPCPDQGTITGSRARSYSRTATLLNAECETNWMNGPCYVYDVAIPMVKMTEHSDYTLTVDASGTDLYGNEISGRLTGFVAGSAAYASGSVNDENVTYYAWDHGECWATGDEANTYPCTAVFDSNFILVGILIPPGQVPVMRRHSVQMRRQLPAN